MSQWSGMGMNYGNDLTAEGGSVQYSSVRDRVLSELAQLKSIGINKVRISLAGRNNSGTQYNCFQGMIVDAKSLGFLVDARISFDTTLMTALNFPTNYQANVISLANWLTSIGGVDIFEIGNEMENGALPVTSLSRSGTTATGVVANTALLTNGETATIYGASPSAYNGSFVITITDSTHFTYTIATGSDSATGTIKLKDIATTAVQTGILQIGAAVKASGYTGKLSYSVSNGLSLDGTHPRLQWNSVGPAGIVGSLDLVGFNFYAGWGTYWMNYSTFTSIVDTLISTWGSTAYISEWGVSGLWTDVPNDDTKILIGTRLLRNYLVTAGVSRGYFFTWRFIFNDPTDNFAIRYINGDTRLMYNAIVGGRSVIC